MSGIKIRSREHGRRCGNNGNTAKNSSWIHKEIKKGEREGRKRKGSIKEEVDTQTGN